ncbi:hypothetical protein CR51_17710 [Caballeronia megalochromosomata]|jgi:hypothetical protein|nr:hypothetical protein CR51_17710 [Caballeronia megalochromosomata]
MLQGGMTPAFCARRLCHIVEVPVNGANKQTLFGRIVFFHSTDSLNLNPDLLYYQAGEAKFISSL